ncbi:GNAT family N-acetyltransferase [Telluribacter sp.]|jgi:hypothetical protein|uniref:GNAT family N-acetyltransferase n=1 Tax=Telluribacter sp. TaxID=1978767 RepID=UPI002E0EC2C4|nr:GNAT family N-acetyltransferase [Telluribacter sp.]
MTTDSEPSGALWENTAYKVGLFENKAAASIPISFSQATPDFVPYLYNRADHLLTQTDGPIFTFYLLEKSSHHLLALLSLTVDEERSAWSPPRAPFGGIQCSAAAPPEAVAFLLDCLKIWAQTHSITTLTLKTAPAIYQPRQHELLHQLYVKTGFTVLNQVPNHHIPVSSQAFSNLLSPAERRRLRKCQRAGLVARPWYQPDAEAVYRFVETSRCQQGYALTLTLDRLRILLHQFPDHFLVFAVYDRDTIASLTVAVRVSQEVLYNFLPADNLNYRTYSPTVLLNAALYQYCQAGQMQVLDLGTSLDHTGQPKPSLMRFKERLGGIESQKITYRLEIS